MRRITFIALATVCLARPTVRELRNLADFDKLIEHHKTNTGLPVVVDFYSDSCGPCRMIAPAFKKLAGEMKDRAVFAKVNVQYARDISARERVSSMPTFKFYADGKKKEEFSGAGEYQLRQLAQKVATDAEKKNVALSSEALHAFYGEHDASKAAADVDKILAKCGSLAKAGGLCAGGAARDLAKKLEAKFGAAPALGKRFGGAGADKAPPPPKKKRALANALDKLSTEDVVAELAKRAEKGDDVAAAGADGAQAYLAELAAEEDEDDEDEEEEDPYPIYRPQSNFPERVVIVGGGPGGLSAAVYAARAGLAPVVIAPDGGGQLLGKGVTIENYPGVVGDTGPGLVNKMRAHAADCGAVFFPHKAERVDLSKRPFVVETSEANVSAHTIIVATGADSRWLGIDGEEDFKGGGVSSCATCDGFLFRDMDVAVVGGGDTAMEDALVLARTSKSVTVVHRRDSFRASRALAERVRQHPKIVVRWNATVEKFSGDHIEEEDEQPYSVLRQAHLRDTSTNAAEALDVRAAFVAIGHDPNTWLFKDQLEMDASGYLTLAGGRFATQLSVEGVFAAGDVADPIYRQAITSAGSGAMAALDAERYLSEQGIEDESEKFNDDLVAELLDGLGEVEGVNVYADDVDLTYANAKSGEL